MKVSQALMLLYGARRLKYPSLFIFRKVVVKVKSFLSPKAKDSIHFWDGNETNMTCGSKNEHLVGFNAKHRNFRNSRVLSQ